MDDIKVRSEMAESKKMKYEGKSKKAKGKKICFKINSRTMQLKIYI
jgi:hypothetical protein